MVSFQGDLVVNISNNPGATRLIDLCFNPITDMGRGINPGIVINRQSDLGVIFHMHDIGRTLNLKHLPLHPPHHPIGRQGFL